MKKKIFLFFICLLPVAYCLPALAGGFQVNLQGQKQTGMGHTGTGLLLDASSILFNPGAVSFLDSIRMVQAGGSFIIPRTQYLEPYPGIYTAEMIHNIGTPFTLYAALKIKKHQKFHIGFGIYTPFGSKAQWEDDWKGQFIIREINLKTIFFQPTVSYKVTSRLGVGAGFVYASGSFGLRKGIPVQDTAGYYGEAALDGSASGIGFNAGIYLTPCKNFSVGIDYRSAVNVQVTGGTASFDVPSSLADYFPATTFSSRIKLPQVASIGIGWIPDSLWRFAADVNFIGWSSYDTLRIDFTDNTEKLDDVRSARMYKDVCIFRVGTQYAWKKYLTLRLGGYYDITPVQDGYLTPETPDAHRIGISTGATLKISDKVNIDASLLYIESKKRYDINLETQFGGTFKTKAVVPGIGMEVRF